MGSRIKDCGTPKGPSPHPSTLTTSPALLPSPWLCQPPEEQKAGCVKGRAKGLEPPELATNNYHRRYEIEGCCFLPDQLSTVEPWPWAKKRHLHLCFISRLGSRRPVNGSVAFQDLLLLLFLVGVQAKVQGKFYRFWGWPRPTILPSQGPSVLPCLCSLPQKPDSSC